MRSRIFLKKFRTNTRKTNFRKRRFPIRRRIKKRFNKPKRMRFNRCRRRRFFIRTQKVKDSVKDINDCIKCNEGKKAEDSDIEMIIEKMDMLNL